MGYFYYRLSFESPVHFGQGESGGKLENSGIEYCSDSIFSAMCSELAQMGELELLNEIFNMATNNEFLLSDLFPYTDINGDELYYLPRPFLFFRSKSVDRMDMEKAKELSALRKVNKKQQYIRVSELTDLLKAIKNEQNYILKYPLGNFAEHTLVERVNCRRDEALPYYVAYYSFAPNTGLYGVVKMPDSFAAIFEKVMKLLGLSGIGGKRSSGYGKFSLDGLFEMDDMVQDTAALLGMLTNVDATTQMSISILKPGLNELENVKSGQYQLKKRSGFTDNIKRDSLYMVGSGSCFNNRLDGEIVNLSGYCEHNVWRYGKGLFVGLEI